ncbi:SMP-30/gluconolactonase/LRE family protein [Planktotalea arctica]|uniref:SMP-30/gluconolactonase/LRE family protein n=1 Tax=Planktotalea arctica TaxID=1481893 RepID=UPI000A17290E|nr:SMP-30/gluconolactonase/LRE family protein [Planktotalea arctica]
MIYDDRPCSLGEGPLWHPLRRELFWFDINARTLHSKAQSWTFDLSVSAAGWIDAQTLLIASEVGLHLFEIASGTLSAPRVMIEEGNRVTRSNDGRADPWGGFWIGTMGYNAEAGAGAIYRFFGGELRKLVADVTISNAICFTPDRTYAHFTDTVTKQIMRIPLDPDTGWPGGAAEVWLDLNAAGLSPDGAIIDASGTFWVALWGAGCVNTYGADSALIASHKVGGVHATCPAFGGDDLGDLFVTSASEGITGALGENGMTFCLERVGTGQQEHQVIL